MYVRVVSNISNHIYQSMVYAKINVGWFQQYVLYDPYYEMFELVEYLDKTTKPIKPRVYTIQSGTEGFIKCDKSLLSEFKTYCKINHELSPDISFLFGYPDVCKNFEFLRDILSNKQVSKDRYTIQLRDLADINEWHYIKTQKDADDFMALFAGFHDATLESVCYKEDDTGKKEAAVIFDNSGWFGIAELCFEGVQLLKLLPADENYTRYIMEASLHIDDNGVFWADDFIEQPDLSCEASVIKALSVKWRKK